MSPPGIYVAGATTAITRRTVLRKAFLAPWDPRVSEVLAYSLADAQRATGVAIHQFVPVVSHYHGDVTPRSDNLPEFLRRLNRDISCGLHTLLCQQRYDAVLLGERANRPMYSATQPGHRARGFVRRAATLTS